MFSSIAFVLGILMEEDMLLDICMLGADLLVLVQTSSILDEEVARGWPAFDPIDN